MTDLLPLLATAFATGLLGSAHCLGMCAGISGLFTVRASAASLRTQIPKAIAYNIGRVLSYAFFGMLVATVGHAFVDLVPALAGPVRIAGGILIVIVGLQVALRWRILTPVENAGAALWNRIAPAAKGIFPVTTTTRALGLGLIWGCLPCGLVYSMLLLAATSAEPASGGLVMVAFGLGTMPAMVLSGLSATKLAAFMSRNRLGAGLLIVVLGIATMALPLTSMMATDAHVHAVESRQN